MGEYPDFTQSLTMEGGAQNTKGGLSTYKQGQKGHTARKAR